MKAQFTTDHGDGWKLFGVFLMLVAIAVTVEGALLRAHEKKDAV